VPPILPRLVRAFAPVVLVVLLAQPARGDVDGGAPGGADAAPVTVTETGGPDAAAAPAAPAIPPAPSELATPPELTSASLTKSEPQLVAPPPGDVEPPRPITRRLWFWIAVSAAIVVTTGVVMTVQNPSTTRPGCPDGYVCPR
jgi:hypothetical protein